MASATFARQCFTTPHCEACAAVGITGEQIGTKLTAFIALDSRACALRRVRYASCKREESWAKQEEGVKREVQQLHARYITLANASAECTDEVQAYRCAVGFSEPSSSPQAQSFAAHAKHFADPNKTRLCSPARLRGAAPRCDGARTPRRVAL